ncbi:MAG: ABC transporter ATP-binding protein [Oscillospiraceae bacterium]|jgi:putative ABC transport system ATP-binding protein|nr:ABC transporter ATP-binding protein [Oscillospiraceae bacterium]
MDLISLSSVSKKYGGNKTASVCALNHVSLSIQKGERLAIMGASGAGKSTLLHLIGCLDTITEGSYFLDGREISALASQKELAKIRSQKIGFVLQNFALLEDETVFENILMPRLFCKIASSDAESYAKDLMEQLHISKLAKKRVRLLSGGEKQRTAIARALINRPDILLADEPTGALDSANSKDVLRVFDWLHQEGKTIIIVTHDVAVANCCERKVMLSDGRIVSDCV